MFARTRYVMVPWVHANVGYGTYPHPGRVGKTISTRLSHAQLDAMRNITVHTGTVLPDVDTPGQPADARAQVELNIVAGSVNIPQKIARAHFRTHHYTSRYNFPIKNCNSTGTGVSPWGRDLPKDCLGEATYFRHIAAQVRAMPRVALCVAFLGRAPRRPPYCMPLASRRLNLAVDLPSPFSFFFGGNGLFSCFICFRSVRMKACSEPPSTAGGRWGRRAPPAQIRGCVVGIGVSGVVGGHGHAPI